jgi:hypothetical protein
VGCEWGPKPGWRKLFFQVDVVIRNKADWQLLKPLGVMPGGFLL